MTAPICPKCQLVIPQDDFNVATDLAHCRVCDATYAFSDLVHAAGIDAGVDLQRSPKGAWYENSRWVP